MKCLSSRYHFLFDVSNAVHRMNQRTLTLPLLIFCSITQAIPIVGGDVKVIAGQDVELVCNVTEAGDLIQIEWMRTTMKMVQRNIFTIVRAMNPTPEPVDDLKDRLTFTGNVQEGIGNIILKEAKMNDTGNYSCNLIFLDGSPVSKTTQLKVQAQPKVTIAPLVGKCEATIATCSADNAFPAAEVSWITNSLGNTIRFTTTSTENPDGTANVTGILMGVTSRDIHQKEVQCLIRHPTLKGEELTINYSISTYYPPLSPRVTPLESPSLGFKCQVDGNPEAVNYTWRRNGRLISNGADRNILHFQELTSDMNGLYDCEVSNVYGSATGSLHLYIKNERHYFFFWIPFIVFLNTIGVCLLLNRFVQKRGLAEIISRYVRRQNEETTYDEPSHIEVSVQSSPRPMHESRSPKDSPEQSAHMMPKEKRSSREEDT